MNFTIDRLIFENSLRKITAISSSKSELTKFLLIDTFKDKLTLSTTDQDIISYVKLEVKNKFVKDSRCIIEAKALYNLINTLPKTTEEVTVTKVKGGTLAVTVDKNLYQFKNFDIKFPEFDIHSYIWSFRIDGSRLFPLIKNSGWAYAVKDEEREYLQGVLFEVDKKLFVCSTDARKFSCSSTDIDNIDTKFRFVILSKLSKIINNELIKYKPKKKTDKAKFPLVTFRIGKEFVDIKVGNTHYTSKLLSNKYPDIRFKKFKLKYNIVIPKKSLSDSIKRLTPFTDSVKNMISFVCDRGTVELKSYNISEKLNSIEDLGQYWLYKEPFEIGFRASSMLKILQHAVGKELTIEFESADRFFKIQDPDTTVNTFYMIPYSKF